MSDGATWLASYPKSGNTWLRCLLDAYKHNGELDPNYIRICTSDGGAGIMQGVSPIPIDILGVRGEMLLRPAALLNLFTRLPQPIFCKTHFANITPEEAPPLIPREFTKKAIYIVRDPRDVVGSFSKFYGFSLDKACDAMSSKEFVIGGNDQFSRCFLSSWSNHVASWTSEDRYPVHVVRYEDLIADTSKELTDILTFLEWDVDEERIARSVKAAQISRMKKAEKEAGFKENQSQSGKPFFGDGGSRWRTELGKKWSDRIEQDHGAVMNALGYLDKPLLQVVGDEKVAE